MMAQQGFRGVAALSHWRCVSACVHEHTRAFPEVPFSGAEMFDFFSPSSSRGKQTNLQSRQGGHHLFTRPSKSRETRGRAELRG